MAKVSSTSVTIGTILNTLILVSVSCHARLFDQLRQQRNLILCVVEFSTAYIYFYLFSQISLIVFRNLLMCLYGSSKGPSKFGPSSPETGRYVG